MLPILRFISGMEFPNMGFMMQDSKKREVMDRINALCDIYRVSLNNLAFEMYYDDLEKYDIKSIDKAILKHRRHLKDGRFMPTPAHLLNNIEEYLSHIPENMAEIAWDNLMQKMREHGRLKNPIFDDNLIDLVIESMGGWNLLCNLTTKDLRS